MNNKKFFTLLGISIGVLAVAIALYFLIGPATTNDENKNKSEELKKYEALYNLKLVDEEEDYYVITGLTLANQRGENNSHIVSFPKTIDNIKVKKIISSIEFTDYKFIKKIIIPEYVEYIGTNEESKNITDEIFVSCASLEQVEVDENNKVFSSLNGILYNKDKTELVLCPRNYVTDVSSNSKITIIDGVKRIGNYAFYNNLKIVEINFNQELESIGICAFNNSVLLKNLNFSTISNLTTIENAAFNNCDQLVNIILPDSVTKLGATCFGGCGNLKEVYIPDSVQSFGNEVVGGSLNCTITTSENNNKFLKSMCTVLSIKNKDKDVRIQIRNYN